LSTKDSSVWTMASPDAATRCRSSARAGAKARQHRLAIPRLRPALSDRVPSCTRSATPRLFEQQSAPWCSVGPGRTFGLLGDRRGWRHPRRATPHRVRRPRCRSECRWPSNGVRCSSRSRRAQRGQAAQPRGAPRGCPGPAHANSNGSSGRTATSKPPTPFGHLEASRAFWPLVMPSPPLAPVMPSPRLWPLLCLPRLWPRRPFDA